MRTGSKAAILVYHRISTLTPDSHHLCTPPDAFHQQMDYIRRECSPIGLEDLVRAAAAGRIPDRAVAVTLDDGYVDALTAASPILSELGVPATFFINSDRLTEEHERWWDTLERVLLSAGTVPSTLRVTIAGETLEVPTATARERAAALDCLNRRAWPLNAEAREGLIAHVAAWSGADISPRQTHRVLTDTEIRALATRPGHTIGAHSVHHLALTAQPAGLKRAEIEENKVALERVLQQPVRLFSYPYGEFDADLVRIAGAAGFMAAVTVQAGLVCAGMNRLLLPRFEITPRQHQAFAAYMQEIFKSQALSLET
jgi:peptidoglycan/xylan/chitin deacetylase (PgdA/CDA1 family)